MDKWTFADNGIDTIISNKSLHPSASLVISADFNSDEAEHHFAQQICDLLNGDTKPISLIDAASATLASCAHFGMCRHTDGLGEQHANWMLDQIVQGFVTGEKAAKWLGWAQCGLTVAGCVTMNECRAFNSVNCPPQPVGDKS